MKAAFAIGMLTTITTITALSSSANARSLFDAAAVADVGYSGTFDGPIGQNMRLGPELGLRLDLLWILGVEADVKPFDLSGGAPVVDARFKLSGLVYLLPFESFSLYLKAGVGSMDALHLLSFRAIDASIHAGVGLEIRTGDSIAIGVEGLLVSDGVQVLANKALALAASGDQQAVMHAVTPKTFMTKVGIRYYF
jgi:hypothetical protein